MRLATLLGVVGRLLIWAGTIVLLFVAYQLWGTNIAEARAQDDLESAFLDRLEAHGGADVGATTTTVAPTPSSTSTSTTATVTTTSTATTTTSPLPPPDDGQAIARITIPAIDVDKIVVEGVGRGDLRKGPGHYPDTPMPGQPGNSAIAGHRTTYGAPFHRVDELVAGDEIIVTTLQGSFHYRVLDTRIVEPSRIAVLRDQGDDRLTLTSCHPKFSAAQRIVVSALLVDDPVAPPVTAPAAVVTDDGDGELAGEEDAEIDAAVEAAEPTSLDAGETRTAGPAVVWGAITAGVWLMFFGLSRRWRRWPSYVLGAPVFLVSLYVFFESFAEVLPANF